MATIHEIDPISANTDPTQPIAWRKMDGEDKLTRVFLEQAQQVPGRSFNMASGFFGLLIVDCLGNHGYEDKIIESIPDHNVCSAGAPRFSGGELKDIYAILLTDGDSLEQAGAQRVIRFDGEDTFIQRLSL